MTSIKTKKELEILRKIDDIIKRYNNSVCFLNKNSESNKFIFMHESNKQNNIKNLRKCISCNVKINTLNKIILNMKQLKNPDYMLVNLWKQPQLFINNDNCLITFNILKKLCNEFKIQIDNNIIIEKWFLNLFNSKDTIYISKSNFVENLNKSISNDEIPHMDKEKQKTLILKAKKEICVSRKFYGETYYTSKYLENLQKTLSNKMKKLFYNNIKEKQITLDFDKKHVEKFISEFQIKNKITFDSKQTQGIYNLINNKLGLLNGYPGTGKSEILNCVCQYLETHDKSIKNISLCAPTGLATNNLIERCVFDKNTTINSNLFRLIQVIYPKILISMSYSNKDKMLELCYDKLGKTKDENELSKIQKDIEELEYYKNKPDIIIVDESSMINLELFAKLIHYVEQFNCRIIFVGDENQLQPIGGGIPFYDLLNSKLFCADKLHNIFRNSGSLSKNIIKMNKNIIYKHDFIDNSIQFININKFIKNNRINIPLFSKFIQNNNLNKDNTKFLTPQKDHLFGYNNLNILLQRVFNPTGIIITNLDSYSNYKNFRVNDYIIRIVNNYEENKCMANGDTGKIVNIELNNDIENVNIKYDKDTNVLVSTSNSELHEEFDLSYCLSVHKSQGHGFDNIVLFISKQHNYMWKNENSKKLLYTAISRAKQKCIIIGDYDMFISSQKGNSNITPSIFMKEF